MMIRAEINLAARELVLEDKTYSLDTDEGLAKLRELTSAESDADREIVAKDVVAYSSGWNRKYLAPHPDHLGALAATMAGSPHYHGHDETRELGRCGPGRVVVTDDGETVVRQDLVYSTPLAMSILATGADQRISIAFDRTEESEIQCSLCGEPWDGCDHWPGDRAENGERMQALLTYPIHRETSTTHSPACTGTGSDAARATVLMSAHESDILLTAMRERSEARQRSRTLAAEQQIEELTASITSLRGEVTELQAARQAAETESARLELQAAKNAVRKLRADRGLRTPSGLTVSEFETRLAGQYISDRSAYDLWASTIPESTLSQTVTGGQPPAPAPAQSEREKYQQLARRAEQVHKETAEPYSEILRRLKQEGY